MNSDKIISLSLLVLFTSASCFGSEKSAPRDKDKQPPEYHRGWIGGEYRLARRHWSWSDTTDAVIAFPAALTNIQKGVLITALATNTPAYIAGLREADLILELDHDSMNGRVPALPISVKKLTAQRRAVRCLLALITTAKCRTTTSRLAARPFVMAELLQSDCFMTSQA
jgi:hypothetical protein